MADEFSKALSTLGSVTPNTRAKTIEIMRHVQSKLGRAPGVLWGKGSSDEHATGRAVDFMVTHHGWGTDREMGDLIADYVIERGREWGLGWVIWRQRIYPASGNYLANPNGGWRTMEDRGSSTQNHYDHPHVYWIEDRPVGSTTPTNQEDEPMDAKQFDQLIAELRGLGNSVRWPDTQEPEHTNEVGVPIAEGHTHRQLREIGEHLVALRGSVDVLIRAAESAGEKDAEQDDTIAQLRADIETKLAAAQAAFLAALDEIRAMLPGQEG